MRLIKRLWTTSAPLTAACFLLLAAFFFSLVSLVLDPRIITGAPAWLNPLNSPSRLPSSPAPWRGSITGVIVPLLLALLYCGLILAHFGQTKGSFNTLEGVALLFSDGWLLLAGWVHYLAFDLFIGSWEVRDATRNKISRWIVAPCLIATFLLGPIGLLFYFAVRFVKTRRFELT